MNAQEYLLPISENAQLFNKKMPISNKAATINLPFFDDFSNNSVYPSADNWLNSNVFVNNSYGINPPSIGVATFDAIDSKGYVYPNLVNEEALQSDVLTSRIIDLTGVNPDSVYLSFYYQPQGFGDVPEEVDSLILQFVTPDTVATVWVAAGISFESFKKDTLKLQDDYVDTLMFKQVHLKISDPTFLRDNFQFRFINYVSLGWNVAVRTNCDHWNIDYVYLNKGRSEKDTIYRDVAFVEQPGSFLKNFSSIPWAHIEEAIDLELNDLYAHIRNNDSLSRNITEIIFDITDTKSQWNDKFGIGDIDLDAYTNRSDLRFQFETSFIEPNSNTSANFEIQARLFTDGYDIPKSNNTANRTVVCDNYYAYDDGTAEYAYGLNGNARMVAYLYKTYQPDTLRAFSMYFLRNQVQESALDAFNIGVWESVNGAPGARIYDLEIAKEVAFSVNMNEFVTIELDSAIYLENEFFIGWDQQPGMSLNLGFDANINTTKKRYYYNGGWVQGDDDKPGSLMLRPIFGKPLDETALIDNTNSKQFLSVYPNPSNGKFTIQNLDQVQSGTLSIFNSLGSLVGRADINSTDFDFSYLKPGMYIINIVSENSPPQILKWLKN